MNARDAVNVDPAQQFDPAGDREVLFTRLRPYLLGIAKRKVDYAAASDASFGIEDLAQEIALNLHLQLPRYDPARSSFKTFVGVVARSTVQRIRVGRTAAKRTLPQGRTAARKRKGGTHERLSVVPGPESLDPRREAERREQIAMGKKLWKRLPKQLTRLQRQVVTWYLRDGLAMREIAERMGCSASNVWITFEASIRKLHKDRQRLLPSLGI